MGFMPVRYITYRDGAINRQADISYSEDEEYGWVPSSWHVALLTREGAIWMSYSGKVTDYALNEEIPAEAFDIEFPSGAYVRDYVADKRYLVREDGRQRPLMPGELSPTNYQELLHSEPLARPTSTGIRPVPVVVSLALAAILLASYIWCRVVVKQERNGAATSERIRDR